MLANPPTYRPSTQSILIVDDNDIILDMLTKAFEMFGLNVLRADNGLDAWNLFKSEKADIVLTDIRMPYLNGLEMSRLIRNVSPKTTIALITGGDGDVAAKLVKDGTADYFFMKPFDLNHVCKSLITQAQKA